MKNVKTLLPLVALGSLVGCAGPGNYDTFFLDQSAYTSTYYTTPNYPSTYYYTSPYFFRTFPSYYGSFHYAPAYARYWRRKFRGNF